MIVRELIAALEKLPQEKEVYFDDGGYYLEPVELVGEYKKRGIVVLDHLTPSQKEIDIAIEKDDNELANTGTLIDGGGRS